MIYFFSVFCLLNTSYARTPIKLRQEAMRLTQTPKHLEDDLALDQFIPALKENIKKLKRQKKRTMVFGEKNISALDYAKALEGILSHYQKQQNRISFINYIKNNFSWHEVYGRDNWSEVLLTSYYTPLYDGRLVPEGKYTQPIYRLPDNIKYPFLTREQIDVQNKLKDQNLELYYLDPIDAFFLQIQGSGTIKLKNGTHNQLSFAGHNGRSYESIGKRLYHIIPKKEMSLQRIETYLRGLSEEKLYRFLKINPRYIFFRKLKEGLGRTTFNTQVLAGRTIAIDNSFFSLGAIAYLQFPKPQFKNATSKKPNGIIQKSRFVLAQDTGSAIKGPDRVDLYWGEASEALRYAGIMKHPAKLWFLVPK
jgi:membrane-bound lytic murein transglycosylase A